MFSKAFKIVSFFVALFLMIGSFHAKAQEKSDHFIYIQSETKQPFYVILNSKVYSSSSIGYLIIPKLKDGKYDIKLGFPKDIYPEQNFTCTVSKTDVGYSLHNKNDKDWSLLNLQTQEAITAGNTAGQNSSSATQSSVFGNMLSDVTNDSTITQQTPDVVAKPVEEETTKEVNASQLEVYQDAPPAKVLKTDKKKRKRINDADTDNVALPAPPPADTKPTPPETQNYTSGVVKSYQKKVKDGTEMAFLAYDNTNLDGDSVHIFIPSKKQEQPAKNKPQKLGVLDSMDDSEKAAPPPSVTSNQDIPDNNIAGNDKKTIPATSNQEVPNNVADNNKKKISNPFFDKKNRDTENKTDDDGKFSAPIVSNAVNSDCTNIFSDEDMPALRKRMITRGSDEEMIDIARKYLKGKCVTTEQIKSLGNLFLSDSGRYGIFEMLYRQVYDIGAYPSLQNQLFDKYYINRFKALIGQ
ncbi:MAG: DUF4476 domain-containing protein [Chitinophagaceae bacterium]|jgi:hypothetical protein|nr:DUF4476 domain-containing protein [Chitinophagaceae bacterium]